MNLVTATNPAPLPPGRAAFQKISTLRLELSVLAIFILLFNLPLLGGACAREFIFLPDPVHAGQWWRVLTHPLVHVSWYHLLLDATAFLFLYEGLRAKQWFERLGFVFAAGAGSLLVSLWTDPLIQTHGLCGLSGVAHGLMAISALEMMHAHADKTIRRAGFVTFLIVVIKCVHEAFTGSVMFERLHFGPLGTPVAVCHAGGALGALIVWMLVNRWRQQAESPPRRNESVSGAAMREVEPV